MHGRVEDLIPAPHAAHVYGASGAPNVADGLSNACNQLSVGLQRKKTDRNRRPSVPSASIISYHINSSRIYAWTVSRISDFSEEKKRERICGYLCQSGLCPMQSPTSTRSGGE